MHFQKLVVPWELMALWHFFFRKVGLIEGALDVSEEQAFELFIDLGASEFEKNSNGNWVIETDVPNLQTLTQALTAKEMSVESAEIAYLPNQVVHIDEEEQALKIEVY